MEPKTLEDYRDLTKVLKLKIVKQSKIIQQLESKCKSYEDDIKNATFNTQANQFTPHNIDDLKQVKQQLLNSLEGKTKVMQKFLKGTKMFGITPESVFRIADQNYSHCVQSDFFRNVLTKMSLNLNPKQISCLIYILDENFSGYITKQDYENSLYAYEISLQGNCLLYTQECLLRLCGLLHTQRIDLNKFYDEMKLIAKQKFNGVINLMVFEQQVKNYYQGRLKQRQIIGAYNEINLQKQTSIDKKNFLYGVNSFINRLCNQDRFKSDIASNYTSGINLKNSRSQLKIPQKTIINPISNTSGFHEIHRPQDKQDLSIQAILKKRNLTFTDVIDYFVRQKFIKRMGLHQFKKCFETISKQMTVEEISQIFKSIDYNQNGSIDLTNFVNFVLCYYKDTNMILKLIGKSFEVFQTTPEEFWYAEQFDDLSRVISKEKFISIMSSSFETENPENWTVLWNYFDKGKGTIVVQSIVDVWKKYQS